MASKSATFTPDDFALFQRLTRHVRWGDCGPNALACAPVRGNTITLSRFSLLPIELRCSTLYHEALHLLGYDHDCADRGCQNPVERACDFVYSRDVAYRDRLVTAMTHSVRIHSPQPQAPARTASPVLPLGLGALGGVAFGPLGILAGGLLGFILDGAEVQPRALPPPR
jgi:hypothetical protein